jgi:hypothetical protein
LISNLATDADRRELAAVVERAIDAKTLAIADDDLVEDETKLT